MKLCDAHAHIGTLKEREARVRAGIETMICGTDPVNAAEVEKVCADQPLFTPTYGLHPWKASDFDVRDMQRWLEKCAVIGEIGMDSVWCSVPADDQQRAFRRQLAAAQEMGKPVVLHTKGCELEIAQILAQYDVRAVVHWYSCAEHLERYLDLDCMFTIGPDVSWNEPVRETARRVPADRLLVETDGMSAVEWALGRQAGADELESTLAASVSQIAGIRAAEPEWLAGRICANYMKLKSGNPQR